MRYIPMHAANALKKLGQDACDARRRRRITMATMAERAGISLGTLSRVERGDPDTSAGAYASVLFVLGMEGRLRDLADPMNDPIGRMLDEERLPKRIYHKRVKKDE
ncbi:MAG: helix-turn-helix domain-containing protein [Candidatus Methanoplasma sp.]|nr:helix-turn-helix domain-containing protein [Candidatus Methanoplasma sp.]